MDYPTKLAAAGGILVGALVYGVVLRFAERGNPTGPILWVALVVGVAIFVVLRRNLRLDVDEE